MARIDVGILERGTRGFGDLALHGLDGRVQNVAREFMVQRHLAADTSPDE
jgi:hypothetical protein